MKILGFLTVLFITTIFCQLGIDAQRYKEECVVWNNLTRILDHEKKVFMLCEKNSACTGFDCTGNYSESFMVIHLVSLHFCFGLEIHPCHHPVDMDLYIDVPSKNFNYQRRINKDFNGKLNGLDYITATFSADSFLDVEFDHAVINRKNYVKLGVKLAVRVTLSGLFTTWPDTLQRTLIPTTFIPVPACNGNEIPLRRSKCYNTTTTPPTSTKSFTAHPRISCVPNSLNSCGVNQVCVTNTKTKRGGVCTCANGYTLNHLTKKCSKLALTTPRTTPTATFRPVPCYPNRFKSCGDYQICVPNKKIKQGGYCRCLRGHPMNQFTKQCSKVYVPTPTAIIIPEPVVNLGNQVNLTNLTIGLSVAGTFLILLLIVGFVFYKYHKYRQRYGAHNLILNDEEDVEPLDLN